MITLLDKIVCLLIGHDDPVMDFSGIMSIDEHYQVYVNRERDCRRCGKKLKPIR